MKTKVLFLLIAVFTLGIGFSYYFGYKIGFENTKETTSGFRLGANAIYVPDQIPGEKIAVSFAAFEADGFVVIHEEKNGNPGAVIGKSRLLSAGDNENFSIPISRMSQDGETLFAMLHRDDGDQVFNSANDLPITNKDGEPFMMQFIIDKDAVEPGVISL